MIEYVIAENPDDRILRKASGILKNSGLVVVPTDTNWIIACDGFSSKGMDKLLKLKGESKTKHFSFLCDDISTASQIAIIDNSSFRLLKKTIPGHYTFIFPASFKATKAVKASKYDKEVGIRFSPNPVVNALIKIHGNVLASTNLTPDLLDCEEDEVIYSYMMEDKLHGKVDMVLDPGEYEFVGQSTIVSFLNEAPEVLRVGAGAPDIFV